MNVILLEKVGKLGAVGDKASVKAGYARNFLFPTGKAIPATRSNLEPDQVGFGFVIAAEFERQQLRAHVGGGIAQCPQTQQ